MVTYFHETYEPISYGYLDSEQCDILYPRQIDILDAFKMIHFKANMESVNEASYNDIIDKEVFKVEVMDQERFIKNNELEEITNPAFFGTSGAPTPDGLLSNEIFGITQADRSGIYAYIDLVEYFIDPSCYKTLTRLDKKFIAIVHASKRFSIDEEGQLVEDPDGGTGIKWLKDNFNKLSFTKPSSSSRRRDVKVEYIKRTYEKGRLFINKYIVIPPYYRDVNTTGNNPGVGQMNKFYVNLITAAKALRENNNYGMSMADTTCARIQETLKAIYDWFCGNNNPVIAEKGTGMSGKMGIIKRANLSKTTDYSSRLVMSAPELKVERSDDLMVDLDRSACPLAAVAADFYPFMMFHIRRFFETEFMNVDRYPVYYKGELIDAPLKNPMYAFSDDVIKKHLKQYLYSYDNRLIPVEAPVDYEAMGIKNRTGKFYMTWKGAKNAENTADNPESIVHRRLTWVDVIYQAAVKAVEGKVISFTRYPIDSMYNTIYTKVEVSSTKETEPLYVDGTYYRFYPKIRDRDILKPTKDKFVDTMQICNLYLPGMGGDYDGDTGSMKGSFFNETNKELEKYMNSKINFINLACTNVRESSTAEAIQATYNLTKVLMQDKDKLTEPVF